MKVILETSELIDSLNAILELGDAERQQPGLLYAIFDCWQALPTWANWLAIQPDGVVSLFEQAPTIRKNGWASDGQHLFWGDTENADNWKNSLQYIDSEITETKVHGPRRHHAIQNYRRLLPDDTCAITINPDGLVQAWSSIPTLENRTWICINGKQPATLGQHSQPKTQNWKHIHYFQTENNKLLYGTIQ